MIVYIDISNYVKLRANTGIQRVVREFLFRLLKENNQFEYNVLYYDSRLHQFVIIDKNELLLFLNNSKTYKFRDKLNTIGIDNLKENDIFFDMDAVWNNELKRTYLYKRLKNNQVKIFNFIHDLIPIILPHLIHKNTVRNFLTYLYSVYKYSDMVFFNSRSTEKDFLDIKQKINNKRDISTRVLKLGADISSNSYSKNKFDKILKTKYILFVGTLEPRKNHSLVVEVFEKLSGSYNDINLVFIGKAGWNNDKFINRLKKHPLKDKRLYWFENIDDDELKLFYQNAFIVAYISSYEGFGLPVMESLSYGNITVTSKNSSIYEVGKNYADYLRYNSFNELYELLEMYIKNNELYNKKRKFIKDNFKPYSWDLFYRSLINVLKNYNKKAEIVEPKALQFVFISIDVEKLQGTISKIDKYIDFVSEYIVITKKDMIDDFKTIVSNHTIKVIDENVILGEYAKDFSKRDHQSKNWLLRASLSKLNILQGQFIMLDDDNRPLRQINIKHFIDNGKYNAYYFYDLIDWHYYSTEYDFGQHNTKKVLDKDGYELLSYSSHKPQIIDKDIFIEVVEKYFNIGLTKAIDEWSIYFNYAVSHYPYLFSQKKFDVLNWPAAYNLWSLQYVPDEHNFENFYPELYMGGVFKSLAGDNVDEKLRIKKEELAPYLKTKEYIYALNQCYREENIVHGLLKFEKNNNKIYLSSLPYYVEIEHNSWLVIELNYKILDTQNIDKIEIGYFINGKKGYFSDIYFENNGYFEGIVKFSISAISLELGIYDLLIDVVINNKHIYGNKSPYLMKLAVKNSKEEI